MIQFSWGDKIRLKTGQIGIFEEYAEGEHDKAFVIIEPDKECRGRLLVKLKDIGLQ